MLMFNRNASRPLMQEAEGGAETDMSSEDVQAQYEQQQLMIAQLKDMVREREDAIRTKDKELSVSSGYIYMCSIIHYGNINKGHYLSQLYVLHCTILSTLHSL